MTVWLVKFVHMGAIAVWVGGLAALPVLLVQRRGLVGRDLDRLHRLTRFVHVALISPAAFLAIGSGILLVFLRETWVEWFSLKLVLVAVLVAMHIATGLAIVSTFVPGGRRGRVLGALSSLSSLGVACGILWLVLAKPEISAAEWGGEAFRPGALAEFLRPVTARFH